MGAAPRGRDRARPAAVAFLGAVPELLKLADQLDPGSASYDEDPPDLDGALRGKVQIVAFDVAPLQRQLPAGLQAQQPDQVTTLVRLRRFSRVVGRYAPGRRTPGEIPASDPTASIDVVTLTVIDVAA